MDKNKEIYDSFSKDENFTKKKLTKTIYQLFNKEIKTIFLFGVLDTLFKMGNSLVFGIVIKGIIDREYSNAIYWSGILSVLQFVSITCK